VKVLNMDILGGPKFWIEPLYQDVESHHQSADLCWVQSRVPPPVQLFTTFSLPLVLPLTQKHLHSHRQSWSPGFLLWSSHKSHLCTDLPQKMHHSSHMRIASLAQMIQTTMSLSYPRIALQILIENSVVPGY
jgi:hypothetical protein